LFKKYEPQGFIRYKYEGCFYLITIIFNVNYKWNGTWIIPQVLGVENVGNWNICFGNNICTNNTTH